jgi:RES domain-containing protein
MVAAAPRLEVEGDFERHVAANWVARSLTGSSAGGRWAAPGAFPVIYLARPTAAVIVEAYRHLVDDIEGMTAERVRNRLLIRAKVHALEVLDLRGPRTWVALGVGEADLRSDVGDYSSCRRIGHVAHQLGLHGVLAPSASGLGETLALFADLLSADEFPTQTGDPLEWATLPADPRRLRLVDEDPGSVSG